MSEKQTVEIAVSAKQFGFYELLGLKKVFHAIEMANPKKSMKVDYWLGKNDKIVGDAFNKYLEQETDLLKKYAETFSHPELLNKYKFPVEFVVYVGKNDEDTLLNDSGAFFKMEMKDDKPILEFVPSPSYEVEIPSEKEGEEPKRHRMRYNVKFKSVEDKEEFDTKLAELQNTFKAEADIWKLDESQMEGLQVMWKGREEDLTQFRDLLYDNAIKAN